MKHYNPSIIERAQRIFNTKGDNLPDDVSGPVAVIQIEPVVRIVATSSQSTSSASNTILTLSSDKDFYLTGFSAAYIKDATCDNADGSYAISCALDGVTKQLIQFPLLNLTAQSDSVSVSFTKPIKCDRGSALSVSAPTFTAGKFRRTQAFYGYTEEVTAT